MLPSLSIVNVEMKPSLSVPRYANANVSESTCTRELDVALSVSCSKLSTSVIVEPSADMVNVEMKPSSPLPRYANAYVSESTCTRELCRPLFVSCFKFATFVIVSPSAEMVNVLIQPALSLPPNANAYVSESTCTRELWIL